MPAKNIVKTYTDNGFYHVYNRGNNKADIFIDFDDFALIEHLLHRYLAKSPIRYEYKNYFNKIKLHAYCLMSNHFHLFLEQEHAYDMAKFMQSIQTSFAMIINKKYNRIGHVFQGTYKARLIKNEREAVAIINYIHSNPEDYLNYPHSSLKSYIHPETKRAFLTVERFLKRLDLPLG